MTGAAKACRPCSRPSRLIVLRLGDALGRWRGGLLLSMAAMLLVPGALAQASSEAVDRSASDVPQAPADSASQASFETLDSASDVDLKAMSDQQLTVLISKWNNLSPTVRAGVLAESRRRMARAGMAVSTPSQGKVSQGQVLVERRRYGSVRESADGRVLRIERETRVIRRSRDRSRAYGVGFEQRRGQAADGPFPGVLSAQDPQLR